MTTAKLNHRNQQQATQIWQLFQNAYKIEAQVLGLENFPPLNRTVRQIQEATTTFLGSSQGSALVAIAEIENCASGHFHINSFGVSPDHFRQGYGSKLLSGLLDELIWQRISVTTAVANTPALNLYKKHDFIPQEESTTPDNIQLVTLYKDNSN